MEFEVVTDEVVQGWEKEGREKARSLLTGCGNDADQASNIVLELFWRCVDGKLKNNQVVSCLENVDETLIADVCWLVGMQIREAESEAEKGLSPKTTALCDLIQGLVGAGVCSKSKLTTQCELELLESLGFGQMKKMKQSLVRENTNRFYRQSRYNLLSEESEGYAKLVTELEALGPDNVDTVISNMQSLIGFFHLDPNRVCDIVLDAYEMDPTNLAFVKLIKLFRRSHLKHVLGFKYQMYHRDEGEEPKETPESLYRLTVVLISAGLIELDSLVPHLYPSESQLQSDFDSFVQHMKANTRKIGRVSLAAKTAEERRQEQEEAKAREQAFQQEMYNQHKSNQLFSLAAAMLSCNAWDLASTFSGRFSLLYRDILLEHPKFVKELLGLISRMVQPLVENHFPGFYPEQFGKKSLQDDDTIIVKLRSHLGSKAIRAPETLETALDVLAPMLLLVGHQLCKDTVLMAKLCRLLTVLSKQRAYRVPIIRCLVESVLPSLSILPCPMAALSLEVWNTMKSLTVPLRFDIYERWRSLQYERNLALIAVKAEARHQTKQILKRVAKEREVMRLSGRRFAKVAHNNPLIAFEALLENVQSYDNLIPIVVESLKYVSPLGLDVLAYLILISISREDVGKVKSDGTSHSHWLQSLCKFTGFFYQKYPMVELEAILHYLLSQLREWKSLDLLMLEEIVSKMTGLEVVEDFSDNTLMAMGGGETLRVRSRSAMGASALVRRKPIVRLRDTLQRSTLIMPLLISIAQQREYILFRDSNSKVLKLTGHTYDKCSAVFIQFSEFLASELTLSYYESILVPAVDLCNRFFLEPVTAFHICRPVIRRYQMDLVSSSKPDVDKTSQWVIGSDAMVNGVEQICKPDVWTNVSPKFYALFWSLSLYDVMVPRSQYDSELERIQTRIQSLERDGDPSLTAKKRSTEIARLKKFTEKLNKEVRDQIANNQFVIDLLTKAKNDLIPENANQSITAFLQNCIIPRISFSAEDALFCAYFVRLLHTINVPRFSTIELIRMTKNIVYSLFCCTEREANNIGVYLNSILATACRWSTDRTTFAKECVPFTGFAKSFDVSPPMKLTFDEFKTMLESVFVDMGKQIVHALDSSTHSRVRPALIICSKIVEYFPYKYDTAKTMRLMVDKLAKEDRQDIQVMAKRYTALLDRKIKSGKLKGTPPPPPKPENSKVPPPGPSPTKSVPATNGTAAVATSNPVTIAAKTGTSSAKAPATSQSTASAPSPTAPKTPKVEAVTNGKRKAPTKDGEEDGEIKDTPRQPEKASASPLPKSSSDGSATKKRPRDDENTANVSTTKAPKGADTPPIKKSKIATSNQGTNPSTTTTTNTNPNPKTKSKPLSKPSGNTANTTGSTNFKRDRQPGNREVRRDIRDRDSRDRDSRDRDSRDRDSRDRDVRDRKGAIGGGRDRDRTKSDRGTGTNSSNTSGLKRNYSGSNRRPTYDDRDRGGRNRKR